MNVHVRAEAAARLLNDPLLNEALDLIERQLVEEWSACPVRDVEGREKLWLMYKTAQRFRNVFIGAVEDGKVAGFREKQTWSEKAINYMGRR